MIRSSLLVILGTLIATPAPAAGPAAPADSTRKPACQRWDAREIERNPTARELRCRYGVGGPGRFGLLSYADVPVYQPATPMPGTHVVGLPGHAGPRPGESYERWEWRVLRTSFGEEARRTHRGLEALHPFVASRILALEARLRAEGIRARRRETWRTPDPQAIHFQQGRSRPDPLATTTLTSWHSQVDSLGRPAGRAVDYSVPPHQMERFHQIAAEVGLESFGHDSNDPGHVFLPAEESLPRREIVLLRLLPRVPVVTLATGRPVDDPAPGTMSELREAVERFTRGPFLPHPTLRVAGAYLSPSPITAPVYPAGVSATAAAPPATRAGAAAGDDPGAPRRGAARGSEGAVRSRGG